MDIEKILSLVAIVVYGLVSTILSIVRTLKTSRISSEVKSAFPLLDGKDKDKDDDKDDDKDKDESSGKVDVQSLNDVDGNVTGKCSLNYEDFNGELRYFLDYLFTRYRDFDK